MSYFDALQNACEVVAGQSLILSRLKWTLEDWNFEFARFLSSKVEIAENKTAIARNLLIRS